MTVPILAGSYLVLHERSFSVLRRNTLDKKKGEKGQKRIKMENSEIDPSY